MVAPAHAPLLAAVRVGGVVYYLAVCLLTFSPIPRLIQRLYKTKTWGQYAAWGMGLGHHDSQYFRNVLVLALWVAVPAGWLAARHADRNQPFD